MCYICLECTGVRGLSPTQDSGVGTARDEYDSLVEGSIVPEKKMVTDIAIRCKISFRLPQLVFDIIYASVEEESTCCCPVFSRSRIFSCRLKLDLVRRRSSNFPPC